MPNSNKSVGEVKYSSLISLRQLLTQGGKIANFSKLFAKSKNVRIFVVPKFNSCKYIVHILPRIGRIPFVHIYFVAMRLWRVYREYALFLCVNY